MKNIDAFETYSNAIHVNYESEDILLTGWLYKLNTPEVNRISRSQNWRGTGFKQNIVEYNGNNCYNPTSGSCFIKCNIHLIGKDYKEDFLTFTRSEQRLELFCKKHNVNIGCYDGFGVFPRNITEKDIALYMYKNHFCLIWTS